MMRAAKPQLATRASDSRVLIPGTLLLIQLPANAPGRAVEAGPDAWALPPVWKARVKIYANCRLARSGE